MDIVIEKRNIDELIPHPRNEEFFDHIHGDMWFALVDSIEKNGLKEPILITDKDVIVSGHERVRVYEHLGIEEIDCIVNYYDNDDEILRDLIEINILQRGVGNPNPIKFGRCIKELKRIYGVGKGNTKSPLETLLSEEEFLDKIHVTKPTCNRYETLAGLPKEYQDLIEAGTLSPSTGARFIATLSEEDQMKLLELLPSAKKYTQKQIQDLYDDMKLQLDQKNEEILVLKQEKDDLANNDTAFLEKQKELEKTQVELRKIYERAEQQSKTIEKLKKASDESAVAAELVKSDYKLLESLSVTLTRQLKDIGNVAKYMKSDDKDKYQKLLSKIEDDAINAMDNIKHCKNNGKIVAMR